jgi:hypothetical protein
MSKFTDGPEGWAEFCLAQIKKHSNDPFSDEMTAANKESDLVECLSIAAKIIPDKMQGETITEVRSPTYIMASQITMIGKLFDDAFRSMANQGLSVEAWEKLWRAVAERRMAEHGLPDDGRVYPSLIIQQAIEKSFVPHKQRCLILSIMAEVISLASQKGEDKLLLAIKTLGDCMRDDEMSD